MKTRQKTYQPSTPERQYLGFSHTPNRLAIHNNYIGGSRNGVSMIQGRPELFVGGFCWTSPAPAGIYSAVYLAYIRDVTLPPC